MNFRRIRALAVKERKQLLREPASFVIGIVLPIVMLLIFGYGMNTDVRGIKLAIVSHESSSIGDQVISRFQDSEFFDVTLMRNTHDAEIAVQKHNADAVLFLPDNLQKHFADRDLNALVAVNASNPSVGQMHEAYIKGVLMSALQGNVDTSSLPGVRVQSRMWFNDKNDSAYYMIPGVIVIVMAMIGCMLTALQMAKEYEHGNMEQMFVTPMTSAELLIAKMINNYILGMIGMVIALLMARFLFGVPIRGSILILLLGGTIFLLLQMSFGLLISSVTKSQFLSCIISMLTSFMPSFLLSGFLYEISSMPVPIQIITYIFPGRYFVDFLQTTFLVGNVPEIIIKNLGIMSFMTLFFLNIARIKNPKKLESQGISV